MATDNSKITLGLPALPSDNLPPTLYDDFLQIHNAIKNLLDGVSRYSGIDPIPPAEQAFYTPNLTLQTGNLSRIYVVADFAITAGQAINLYNSGGQLRARLASAAAVGTQCHGIANNSAAPGGIVEMYYMQGMVSSVVGMVVGDNYWLSPTSGLIQNVAPTAAGTIRQSIGVAYASNNLLMSVSSLYIIN